MANAYQLTYWYIDTTHRKRFECFLSVWFYQNRLAFNASRCFIRGTLLIGWWVLDRYKLYMLMFCLDKLCFYPIRDHCNNLRLDHVISFEVSYRMFLDSTGDKINWLYNSVICRNLAVQVGVGEGGSKRSDPMKNQTGI